jgi:Winged helix-turn helix
MPQGRHTSLTVCLTPDERRTLTAWQRSSTISMGRARRARILLLLAEGRSITQIADTVGISRRFVYKWAARFRAQGVGGLADLPRPGPWRARRADDDEACPFCGEDGCERSCTGALLADEDVGEEDGGG